MSTATKDQEWKAVEKIRKIIEELGGVDSYVGQALKGCLDLAEDNISNDFFRSMQDQAEAAEEKRLKAEREKKEALEAYKNILKDYNSAKNEIEASHNRNITLEEEKKELMAEIVLDSEAAERQEKEIDELKDEIIKLKAKLYDAITKEQKA